LEIIKSHKGKIFMILAAFLTSTGQLVWKIGINNIFILMIGFMLYGFGAVLMIKSLTIEKLSVAYPLLCTSYVFALLYGALFLEEGLDFKKIIAVCLISLGVILTSYEK